MPLPIRDLARDPQRIPGAVRLRRIARELLVRQIGVVLDRAGRLHYVDPAGSFADRPAPPPRWPHPAWRSGRRRPPSSSCRSWSVAGLDQVSRLQVGLRAVEEPLHTGAVTRGAGLSSMVPCPWHMGHGSDTTKGPWLVGAIGSLPLILPGRAAARGTSAGVDDARISRHLPQTSPRKIVVSALLHHEAHVEDAGTRRPPEPQPQRQVHLRAARGADVAEVGDPLPAERLAQQCWSPAPWLRRRCRHEQVGLLLQTIGVDHQIGRDRVQRLHDARLGERRLDLLAQRVGVAHAQDRRHPLRKSSGFERSTRILPRRFSAPAARSASREPPPGVALMMSSPAAAASAKLPAAAS